MAMFVVRIIVDGHPTDFKAFERLKDAKARFDLGWHQTDDGEFDSIAVFEIPGATGANEAVAAVRSGAKTIQLLHLKEKRQTEIKRLADKLDFEI